MSERPYSRKADIDALFGPGDSARRLRLTGEDEAPTHAAPPGGDDLPSADELSDAQYAAAVYRLHEDTSTYPRFPWKSLATLAGPMCPEDLVMVAARTGGGKSLFLQNLFDALIVAGRFGLYVGLEQSPDVLRIKWACIRRDIAPKLVLATPDELAKSPQWDAAMCAVQEELRWQKSPEIRVRAHFSATRKINPRRLRAWTEWAVDHGCEFVIIDHIDRVEHGNGANPFHEVSETIRLAKELAAEHRIVMILASQVGRPGDPLEQFMPPALHNLRGAGTKEEESDTVLGIYRPLRLDVTEQELKAVRQGLKNRDDVLEPNTMGVMVLKHRLDGPQAGKVVKLAVRHQRVMEIPERDQYTTTGGAVRKVL
jgi:hypothetical protein